MGLLLYIIFACYLVYCLISYPFNTVLRHDLCLNNLFITLIINSQNKQSKTKNTNKSTFYLLKNKKAVY